MSVHRQFELGETTALAPDENFGVVLRLFVLLRADFNSEAAFVARRFIRLSHVRSELVNVDHGFSNLHHRGRFTISPVLLENIGSYP